MLLFAKWLWITMFENSAKIYFLNLRVIWSVNQSYFLMVYSNFVEITSWVYTKTIILFNLGE